MQSSCLEESGIEEFGTKVIDPVAEETTFVQLVFGGYLQSKVYQFFDPSTLYR